MLAARAGSGRGAGVQRLVLEADGNTKAGPVLALQGNRVLKLWGGRVGAQFTFKLSKTYPCYISVNIWLFICRYFFQHISGIIVIVMSSSILQLCFYLFCHNFSILFEQKNATLRYFIKYCCEYFNLD